MDKQFEQRLLNAVRCMPDWDKKFLLDYAETSASDNKVRQPPKLSVIIGGGNIPNDERLFG